MRFFALDEEWRFTYVNEKAALLLRRQRSELIGKIIWDEFPETIASTFYDQYQLAVASQSSVSFAEYYETLDTWFEVHAYPSPEGLSVYFEDVSDKRRAQQVILDSEKRFRSLVEATAAAVWKTNARGEMTAEEDDWGRLTGQSFSEMVGLGWLDAVHPDDRSHTLEKWQSALSSRVIFEIEHRVKTRSGEYCAMFMRAVPVFNSIGGVEEWVGTHTDITARRRAEEQRDSALEAAVRAREAAERAQEEAETANRGKSEFLATMSHEFRTPLNAILGYTQLIDMGVLGEVTPQQHDHLHRLRSSGLHLLGLVNDILDLSKIEAGRVHISRESGFISEVVHAAVALVGPQAVARGIDYPEKCEGDPRTSYIGDPDRVRQILVNLLSNAVKFTNPGGRVTMSCGVSEHPQPGARLVGEGPWTYLRVQDTGIGIAPEHLVRIFEPFVQADTGYTRSEGGTGLGLAISRRLARLMGGEITVQSKVGEGSTFTLWLQAATETDQPAPLEQTTVDDAKATVDVDDAHRLAAELLRENQSITDRYVRRLREATELPDLAAVSEAYVRDHADTVLSEIVTAAKLLAESRGRPNDLLRDGAEIQRLLAELHGAQRFRLGWAESEVAQDVELLSAELVGAIGQMGGNDDTVEFFRDITARLLEQWKQTSLRGYRFAKAAGKR